MRPLYQSLFPILLVSSLTIVALNARLYADDSQPILTQYATLDSLVAGVYDGFATLGELKRSGDFGIGTFDRIDGEGIVLDGVVYQVKHDGSVVRPDDSTTTPFASVVKFQPTKTFKIDSPLTYEAFRAKLDEIEPASNSILAIRVRGKFTKLRTRSSYAQTPPYPPLNVALANQPEFDLDDSDGALVGYRLPPYVKGLNMPGYHFHYLNERKDQGGHLLQFQIESGVVEIQEIQRFQIVLPPKDSAFYQTDLNVDRSKETQQVEGAK